MAFTNYITMFKGFSFYKLFFIIVPVLVYYVFFFHNTKEKSGVQKSVQIIVATDGAYYPWEFVDSKTGQIKGFEVDLINEIAKRNNLTIKFKMIPWEALMPSLIKKDVDMILGGISITPEREKNGTFLIPYIEPPLRFYGSKEIFKKYANIKDLMVLRQVVQNRSIGVQKGTLHYDFLKKHFKGIKIRVYGSHSQMFLDLESGRIDAVFSELHETRIRVKKDKFTEGIFFGPNINSNYDKILGKGMSFLVQKDFKYIKDFNKTIMNLKKEGWISKKSKQYFIEDYSI